MKIVIIILCIAFFCCSCTPTKPVDNAPTLKRTIARIQPEMLVTDLDALFGIKGQMGTWSGQTGYFVYTLPSGKIISVSCWSKDEKHYVHPNIIVYVQESAGKPIKRIR